MKSFDPTNPSNDTEKLIAELHEKLTHQVRKYMNRCNGKPTDIVLTALQHAMINFSVAIAASCAQANGDIIHQLEYIENVRKRFDKAFDIVKTKMMDKSNHSE